MCVLRSLKENGFYIGYSANLQKRFSEHVLADHLLRLIAAPGSLSTTKLT
jgi:hypothetical protein